MLYFWWGCRKNLKLIILGREMVKGNRFIHCKLPGQSWTKLLLEIVAYADASWYSHNSYFCDKKNSFISSLRIKALKIRRRQLLWRGTTAWLSYCLDYGAWWAVKKSVFFMGARENSRHPWQVPTFIFEERMASANIQRRRKQCRRLSSNTC